MIHLSYADEKDLTNIRKSDDFICLNIEEGVRIIKESTFNNLCSLYIVKLPLSILQICENAFSNCCNLKYVIFFHSNCVVAPNAFLNCSHLKIIVLKDI